MNTLSVTSRYKTCDMRIQDQIKNRREASNISLAFAITLHQDVAIIEHQLKLLFRPNHVFCLHVDAKAPKSILMAIEAIVHCYKKVRTAPLSLLVPPWYMSRGRVELCQFRKSLKIAKKDIVSHLRCGQLL